METLQVLLDLLPFVALGWLLIAVMFRLMGGPIPWPYPRHWRWGSKTLEAAYAVPGESAPKQAQDVPAFSKRQLATVDWLDYNLRRN